MTQLTVGALRQVIKGLPASTIIYLGDDKEFIKDLKLALTGLRPENREGSTM